MTFARIALSAAAWLALLPAAGAGELAEGQPAPRFFLPTYNPELSKVARFVLNDLVGAKASQPRKVIVLSFFDIDCKPCRKELPFLQRLHELYGTRGLAVVAVNCDFKPDKIEAVTRYVNQEARLSFPVCKDRFQALQRRYEVKSFPTMFILDGKGVILKVRVGYNEQTKPFPLAELQKHLGVQVGPLEPVEGESENREGGSK
ncbi:MAG: TlpA family protein disulfide reductase [Deltaproteobacteria bacterium]|nr:TlpA family protein disulfide reductase [Deltaproteobacteria bacterium]